MGRFQGSPRNGHTAAELSPSNHEPHVYLSLGRGKASWSPPIMELNRHRLMDLLQVTAAAKSSREQDPHVAWRIVSYDSTYSSKDVESVLLVSQNGIILHYLWLPCVSAQWDLCEQIHATDLFSLSITQRSQVLKQPFFVAEHSLELAVMNCCICLITCVCVGIGMCSEEAFQALE